MAINGSTEQLAAVEILGPWLLNKGDVLNLHAVAERLGGSYRLAVSSTLGRDELPAHPPLHKVRWKPRLKELKHAIDSRSLRQTFWWLRDGLALSLLPNSVLQSNGFVPGSNLSALLDCSGYAYGDKWSTHRIEKREAYLARLKRHGGRAIMLPQALGPFENDAIRASSMALFRHFDLIYARDEVSRQYVEELGVPQDKLRVAPDITHLLDGVPPDNPDEWANRVCVVPNARMIDKTGSDVDEQYVSFLLSSIRQFRENELEPFLLIHEKNDRPLAERLRTELNFPIDTIDEDAIVSKGILGSCYAVLSSRYHALISALSQGTPAIGTSWAHKYEALFRDYGCSEYLLSSLEDTDKIESTIQTLLYPDTRAAMSRKLQAAADDQKQKVDAMWQDIENLIAEHAYQRQE